jgi:large subunit ribosomal protein L9
LQAARLVRKRPAWLPLRWLPPQHQWHPLPRLPKLLRASRPSALQAGNFQQAIAPTVGGYLPETRIQQRARKGYVMQIILQEDIEKLGHRGDVVTVKPGYARNFLLPRKLALEATTGNMKALERIRTSLAKKTATELDAAQKQAGQLNGISLRFTRKTGENDQLFGSVTSADIAEGLGAQNFKVDKRQIQLPESIKALGEYTVTVKVFRDVTAEVKVHVEKEQA